MLARALLAEGRRTMIAAQNQLGGRRVEEVVIFGDGQHHSTLKQLLEKELSLTVQLVDPFERVEWADRAASASRSIRARSRRSWACCSTRPPKSPPVIDFLHPRKKPDATRSAPHVSLPAAAVAAVVLARPGLMQWRLWSLDSEISTPELTATKPEKARREEQDSRSSSADAARAFAAGDVTWLDELALFSRNFPRPKRPRSRRSTG